MKAGKIAASIVLVCFMSAAVAGSSFGSFSSENQKEIDSLETSFTITAFNLEDEPLELEITSSDVEGGDVVHPKNMRLGTSKVTRNPSRDSQWFLMEDGRYIETTEIPVELLINRARDTNTFDFTVNIEATTSSGTGEGIVQNIAQVRSYDYQVETTAGRTSTPSVNGQSGTGTQGTFSDTVSRGVKGISDAVSGFTGGSSSDSSDGSSNSGDGSESGDLESEDSTVGGTGGAGIEEEESLETSDEWDKEVKTENREENVTRSEEGPTGGFFQSVGVNGVTMVLLALLAGSTLYLVKVI